MSWETGSFEVPARREDADRFAGNGEVEATSSWIKATADVANGAGVPLLVFLAPVGTVDPQYVDFWKPWPRAFGWNYICDAWQTRLARVLDREKIPFVDLRADLAGIPATYRKLDGHWSRKGEAVVADRVAAELEALSQGRQHVP
jgi:lysophospholipase L1-like esterase